MAFCRLALLFCSFWCLLPVTQQSRLSAQVAARDQPDFRLAPISPEASLGILGVGGFVGPGSIAISPDGQMVVFSVCDRRKRSVETDPRYQTFTRQYVPSLFAGCELMVTEVRTAKASKIMSTGSSWSPEWSSDGQFVAFYSDHDGAANLWVWEKKSQSVRRVSKAIVVGFLEPEWMLNNSAILATTLPDGMSIEMAVNMTLGGAANLKRGNTNTESSVVVYRYQPGVTTESTSTTAFDLSQWFGDLVILNASSGSKRILTAGIRCFGRRVSPDGRFIAFTNQQGFTPNTHRPLFDLMSYSLADRRVTVLLKNTELLEPRSFSWSPDSEKLSYCGGAPGIDCYVVPRAGGSAINITPSSHPPFFSGTDRAPLWTDNGQHLYQLTKDGVWKLRIADRTATRIASLPEYDLVDFALPLDARQVAATNSQSFIVIARNRTTKKVAFCSIDLLTSELRILTQVDQAIGGFPYARYSLDVSPDGKTLVYRAQDAGHPAEIWISDREFTRPRQLTSINSHIPQSRLGESRLIEWVGANGEKTRGIVLLPPEYEEGQRYPVILYQYPGIPRTDNLNYYGLSVGGGGVGDMQLFASRGYVVFLPDTPMPRKFSPMVGILEDLQPAINRLAELGIADTKRMGIMGGSYGGYAVLSVITQTKQFKAAVARSSHGDMVGVYAFMGRSGDTRGVAWAETGQGGMGGTPWQYRNRYIENSPFYYLDRVETPLLLIHGSEDPAIPSIMADQTFVGLRRLGKEVEYARYEGEGHNESGWGYANQLDYINRVIYWFDKHLRATQTKNDPQRQANP